MAIWQLKLTLVPKESIIRRFGYFPVTVPVDIVEELAAAVEEVTPKAVEELLSAVFPVAESWSESIRIWGEESGTGVLICYDEISRSIESIELRIDVRTASGQILDRMCMIGNDLKCVFITKNNQLVEPSEEALLRALRDSVAKQFVDCPVFTLLSLKKENQAGKIIDLTNADDK